MTHSYLRWPSDRPDRQSWHVLAKVTETGWHLRCGRVITTDSAQASDHIPADEKSCESCLRALLRDEGTDSPANDPVPA